MQAIFAHALVQIATNARATLWGPAAPALQSPALVGAEPAPALLVANAPSSDSRAALPGGAGSSFDGDEEGNEAAAPPPLPPPPPLQAGDPTRIRLPGRDMPTIAAAGTEQILRAEERERRALIERSWNPQYAEANARRLLTMRGALRERGEQVAPCPELDRLVAESRRPGAAAA